MNPIKKLYQKLLGSSDDEDQVDEDDVETKKMVLNGNAPCCLYFEVDEGSIINMSCYWDGTESSIDAFTELLFNLCSGKMTGNIFEFLARECEGTDNNVFLQIVSGYTSLLESGLEDLSFPHNQSDKDQLIVKPSDLSKKNTNPFE
jgi:hypothetical protein